MKKSIFYLTVVIFFCLSLISAKNSELIEVIPAGELPEIDGVISPGEWDDANIEAMKLKSDDGEIRNAKRYVKNNNELFYFALVIEGESEEIYLWLGDSENQAWQKGTDIKRCLKSKNYVCIDYYYNGLYDMVKDSQQDVSGAGIYNSDLDETIVEIEIPFDSGDEKDYMIEYDEIFTIIYASIHKLSPKKEYSKTEKVKPEKGEVTPPSTTSPPAATAPAATPSSATIAPATAPPLTTTAPVSDIPSLREESPKTPTWKLVVGAGIAAATIVAVFAITRKRKMVLGEKKESELPLYWAKPPEQTLKPKLENTRMQEKPMQIFLDKNFPENYTRALKKALKDIQKRIKADPEDKDLRKIEKRIQEQINFFEKDIKKELKKKGLKNGRKGVKKEISDFLYLKNELPEEGLTPEELGELLKGSELSDELSRFYQKELPEELEKSYPGVIRRIEADRDIDVLETDRDGDIDILDIFRIAKEFGKKRKKK